MVYITFIILLYWKLHCEEDIKCCLNCCTDDGKKILIHFKTVSISFMFLQCFPYFVVQINLHLVDMYLEDIFSFLVGLCHVSLKWKWQQSQETDSVRCQFWTNLCISTIVHHNTHSIKSLFAIFLTYSSPPTATHHQN